MLQPLETYKSYNPIIIIPARMGSSRLFGKPLKKIQGKPMIWHVWSRALKCNIGPVFVATDSIKIAEQIESEGGQTVLTSESHPSGSDRVFEALEKIDSKKKYDLVINLQGDIPSFETKYLKLLVSYIGSYDLCTFVVKAKNNEINNHSIVKTVVSWDKDNGKHGKAIYFSRNSVPFGAEKFWHHIGIYAWKRNSLEKFVQLPPSQLETEEKLEQLRALEFGMDIRVVKIIKPPLSVDTEEDLLKVRELMKESR